jgi:hypothetical protein
MGISLGFGRMVSTVCIWAGVMLSIYRSVAADLLTAYLRINAIRKAFFHQLRSLC